MYRPNVPVLWGDLEHDDSMALRHLLNGGVAFHYLTSRMVRARTIAGLPAGLYLLKPTPIPDPTEARTGRA